MVQLLSVLCAGFCPGLCARTCAPVLFLKTEGKQWETTRLLISGTSMRRQVCAAFRWFSLGGEATFQASSTRSKKLCPPINKVASHKFWQVATC